MTPGIIWPMTGEMQRLWLVGAMAITTVALCLAMDIVQAAVAGAVLLVFLSTVLFLDIRQTIFLLVIVAPLIQAPSIKLGLRWSLPGVLAWLLVPWAGPKLLVMLRAMRPLTAVALGAFGSYVLYTAAVGLLDHSAVPTSDPLLLEQFGSPLLRVSLESARLVGVFAVGVTLIWVMRDPSTMSRAIVLFAWSGAAVAVYGIYQMIGLLTGLPVPLLPGTLEHWGPRPFSTFFEPTGFGSFLAVSLICALYAMRSRATGRTWGLMIVFVIISALLMSTARAGVAAAAVGLVVLLISERGGLRNKMYVGLIGLLVLAVLRIMFVLFGEGRTLFEFSVALVSSKIADRFADVIESIQIIGTQPLGLGQGLYSFLGLQGQGAARMISESGVVGLILLAVLHGAVIVSLVKLRRDPQRARLAPYLAGAYAAATVASLNYFNLADVWIWIPLWLPIALAQGQAEYIDSR